MRLSVLLTSMTIAATVTLAAISSPAAPAPTTLDESAFQVDKVHSSVVFKIRHMGVSNFYGRFNDFSGTFAFDPDDLSAADFNVSVDVGSIDTGNDNRDGHLKTADFFNREAHGTITFKSTKVTNAAKEGMYELHGNLTLLGETKTVTARLEWFGTVDNPRGGIVGGFEAIFTIKRSDFGMDYGVEGGALGDDVTLFVSLEGRKQSEG